MKIAFVKFGGLSSGGTERWLQYMAFGLAELGHDIDFYYCDSAPYLGSTYQHPSTSRARYNYLSNSKVNLIKFEVGMKNVLVPTHDWIDSNFWEIFNEYSYDFVQTAKAGPPEYPFTRMKIPVVELVTLDAGADLSQNIAWSILVSQAQRASWSQVGGNAQRSSIIPVPVFPPTSKEDLREFLGITKTDIVAGFHQAPRDEIFSEVPLKAFKSVQAQNRHFVMLSGSEKYKIQAKNLKLQNVHFVDFTDDPHVLSNFLNTLDIFAHGRSDGETFGTVFAEAMIHGKPCLSHLSKRGPNGHIETIGPAGYVAFNYSDYEVKLDRLFSDKILRESLGRNGLAHAAEFYSYESALNNLLDVYSVCFSEAGEPKQRSGYEYGYSRIGFLQAGPITDPSSISNHILAGGTPEEFDLNIASYFMKPNVTFCDIGANIGLYCLKALSLNPTSRVIAFEPQFTEFSLLQKTKFLNKWGSNFEIYNVALSNSESVLPLSLSGTGSTLNPDFLGRENPVLVENISTRMLDDFSSTIPFKDAFIKIDVEGHEFQVLQGAYKILRECRPILFIEIAKTLNSRNYRNSDFDRTLTSLTSLGYRPLVSSGSGSLKIYDPHSEHDGVRMYLFLPEESFHRILTGLKLYLFKIFLRKLTSRVIRKAKGFCRRVIQATRRRINL